MRLKTETATLSPQSPLGDVKESATKPVTSWFSGGIFSSLFGCKVAQADPQPGVENRANIQQAASSKFKISSSWYSGTKITIPADNYLPKTKAFWGTSADAKELLQQLTQLKGKGTLVLRDTGNAQGKQDMEFQYKNFWSRPSAEQKQKAADYIQSLLHTAYPNISAADKTRLQNNFETYLSPARSTDQLEEDFGEKLTTHLVQYNEAAAPKQKPQEPIVTASPSPTVQRSALQQQKVQPQKATQPPARTASVDLTSSVKQIPARTSPIDYLRSQNGVTINTTRPIGAGNFGRVYAAKIGSKDYVYKEEMNFQRRQDPRVLTDNLELNAKPWRDGDIAASRLKDLPYFAKSALFILEITQLGQRPQRYSVPTDQAKDFLKSLPPGASVKKMGQLIEQAPGKELFKLLSDSSFSPIEHFYAITNQVFGFLEKSFSRNLIHGDLKPENIMYYPIARTLRVIDFGLGAVFGKREKITSEATTTQSGNPLHSHRFAGTPHYLAPEIVAGKFYGAEVDFHSTAVMLIQMLSPHEFNQAGETFFNSKTNRFTGNKIPRSCDEYIKLCGGHNSELGKILRSNPNMKKTIDLFFGVASAPPDQRDAAVQALKSHMEKVVRPALERQRQSQQSSLPPFINILDTLPERPEDSDDDD